MNYQHVENLLIRFAASSLISRPFPAESMKASSRM